MTSIDVREKAEEVPDGESERRHRKAVLYCPVCGHESPVDGDWVVSTRESRSEYGCPECDHVVAVR